MTESKIISDGDLINIDFLSSPPASGKTYVLLYEAARLAYRGGHVLFVSPTIDLAEESFANFKTRFPDCHADLVHSRQGQRCAGRIAKKMRDPRKDGGDVLFIVFASFSLIFSDIDKSPWNVIVDEIPPITHEISKNLTDTYSILTELLDIEPIGSHYSELVAIDPDAISEFHENRSGDDLIEEVREIASYIASEHWENHVITDQYLRLIRKELDEE